MVVSTRCRVRWVGVGASCGISLAAGLGLIFRLVTPDSVVRLHTLELLGLLALLVMPALVLLAVRAHRARIPYALHAPPSPHTPATPPAEPRPRRVVVLAPDLRDNSAQRHRRATRAHHRAAR